MSAEDLAERHPICEACGCDLHSGSCDGAEHVDRPRTPAGHVVRVVAYVCDYCLAGVAAECHTPGCVFWCCPSITAEQGERLSTAIYGGES